jgi:hypothetical protein
MREEGGEEPPRIQDISALGIGNLPLIGLPQGPDLLGTTIRAVYFWTGPFRAHHVPGDITVPVIVYTRERLRAASPRLGRELRAEMFR